ncbi:hypothetical protein AYX14_04196 [Cryptococcus neoformans]|nr:hypothetical protein AYX14_04196 [Cryptococcus neoformans var. grubii]
MHKGKESATTQGQDSSQADSATKGKRQRTINWENDLGNDQRNANDHLIDWLGTPDSDGTLMFYRWKSDNVTGLTREHWSKVALEYLVQKGCATNRDVQSVLRQIKRMWSTFKSANDEINKTGSGGPNGNDAISICPWYSELMPIMSHSAAAMVEPGHSTLDEDEDQDRERLRKRIRQEKEEEEGDNDDIVQWDTDLHHETAAIADVTSSGPSQSIRTQGLVTMPVPACPDRPEVIADRASTSTAPSVHIPSSASESGVSPSGALSRQRVLSVNARAKACSAEDQLQLLAEASEANSERRHKDLLRMQEAKHAILKEGVAAEEKRALAEVKKVDFDMWKEFLALHKAEGASYEEAKKKATDDLKEWNENRQM